jgi:hypothetical protein
MLGVGALTGQGVRGDHDIAKVGQDSTRPSVWSKTATSLVWPSPVARCRTPASGVAAMDVGQVVTYWEHPVLKYG